MYKNIKVVIGANYGDEGKGLVVNNLCETSANPIVAFCNGTAQRGHTVEYEDAVRHVYHHFCSGTREGVPTYFLAPFYLHPMEFEREYYELLSQGITPPMAYAEPGLRVITPYDIITDLITKQVEEKRKNTEVYQSCGYGSWCAIEDRESEVFWNDLKSLNSEDFNAALEEVRISCLKVLSKRGIDPESLRKIILGENKEIVKAFYRSVQFMSEKVQDMSFYDCLEKDDYQTIIFEMGQGLGLDKDNGNDFHTSSKTGSRNVIHRLRQNAPEGIHFNINLYYVTRRYQTRHGDGPMDDEITSEFELRSQFVKPEGKDLTNVFNVNQGYLRYGNINPDKLKARILQDLIEWLDFDSNRFSKTISYNLCITHYISPYDLAVLFPPSNGFIYYSDDKIHLKYMSSAEWGKYVK